MPKKPVPRENFVLAMLLLLAVTAVELWHLSIFHMNLFFDEAQYWSWAKFPAFGYYSKPPMVAWLITATTSVCGDGEFCVRVSSPLVHLGTAVLIYKIAALLYNSEKALYSALVYITMPAVVLSSSLVSTDPALLFFWALAIYCFIKSIMEDSWRWWLLTGVAAGLGMLSKYNMLLFLPSVIIYLGLTKDSRKYLFSVKLWSAALLAFVIFMPNIIWNMNHGMVSFTHTEDNARGGGIALHPGSMLEFLGSQFGVFGPILFGALALILFQIKSNSAHKEERLLIWMILPLFIMITSISLLSRAHANWAAPVYVPATILVVSWLIDRKRKNLVAASLYIHITIAALFMAFPLIGHIPGIKLAGSTDLKHGMIKDPMMRLYGWKDLGHGVSALLDAYPDATLLTDAREIHAELLYYVRPHPFNAIKWNISGHIGDHYDMTTDISYSVGRNFIFVTKRSTLEPSMINSFAGSERVGDVEINPHGDSGMDYYIYYLKGFKGYAK